MKSISHKEAMKLIDLRLDGMLNESQSLSLNAHLDSCNSCSDYAAEMDALPARLQNEFQARWDYNEGPSHRVFEHVTTRARKIPMTNRFFASIRLVASGSLVALLILGINFIVLQMKSNPFETNGTQSVSGSELSDSRLIAFTSDQGGNAEIYTMHADGSNMTNLTNLSAHDVNPVWSPDGKHIAFESDRTGHTQIYKMNADGSNLTQITNEQADHAIGTNYGNTPDPWSPDGKKLIFSETVRGDGNNMLYVMDADGSNKIVLIGEPGVYTFLGWSPDGQKIVYQISNTSDNGDTRIMVASVDGTSTFDGPFFEGDGGRKHHQIHWETSEQFITLSSNSERSTWGLWNLTRFYTTEDDYINYIGSNPILVTSNSPIVAIFDRTYVVENQDSLSWFVYSGAPIPLAPWSFSYLCKTPTDPLVAETFHTISPDKQWDFVSLICSEGKTYFFLMNSDGTEIQQLDTSIAEQSQVNELTWSPDGKHVIVSTSNNNNNSSTDLFRFDIQAMLNDASVKPVQLTTDDVWKYGVDWQPIASNEGVVNEPYPEPTQIVESNDFPPIGTGKGNGKWIAFLASNDGIKSDVHIIHPDGSGLCCTNNLTNFPDHYFWLEWSPNGNDLLFLRDSDTSGGIDILRKTEPIGFEVLVHTGVSREAPFLYRWSPNSEQIAYIDNLTGNFDIYTIYADGRNNTQPKQLTNDPGQEIDFAWSPDGSQIVYQRTNGEQLSIMVMDANGSNQHEVARGKGKVRLYWSVNGNSIYASSTENNWLECDGCVQAPAIYQIDLNGLSVRQLYDEMNADQHTGWYLYDTPQGILYFMRIDRPDFVELWGTWFRADGNSVTEIGNLDPQQICQTTGNVLNESFSPNSRFSVISNFCDGRFDLYLADREAMPEERFTQLLQLPPDTLGQGSDFATLLMTWSADGRWIAYDNGNAAIYILNIEATRQDPANQRRAGGPLLLWQAENEPITFSEIAWQPASNSKVVDEEPTPAPTEPASQNELIAFVSDQTGDKEIYTVNSNGTDLKNITVNPALDVNPVWSPDGKSIAFESSRNGSSDIYVMNFDGSNVTRLTDDPASDTNPVWSPDGAKIIYVSGDLTQRDTTIYIMDSNGQNHRPITSYAPKAFVWSAEWSPDNQFIFFDYGQQIIKVNINSGEAIPVTAFTDVNIPTDFVVSIDGSELLYFTNTCSGLGQTSTFFCNTLKTLNTDGTNEKSLGTMNSSEVCPIEQTSTWRGSFTKWSPDRTKILFLFSCEDSGWIYIANADGSGFKPLTNYPVLGDGPDNEVATADWSFDSQSIVFTSALETPENVGIYTLNVNAVLEDPSMRPQHLANLALASSPVWQPQP